jgi:hypothetical protein
MKTGIRHGQQKWYVAALSPVRLHIARNAGVHLHETTANQRCVIAKLESKQPTVRKRLHSKFSLDPSGSLHNLTEARENVIILEEIKKTSDQATLGDIPQKEYPEEFGGVLTVQSYQSMLVRPPSQSTASV